MAAPHGQGRDRLLQALFEEFGDNGPGPHISMRQVAERLGVHHTLMTYHFGSRPGLLAAVLGEARRRDNAVITSTDGDRGFAALCRAVWDFYADGQHDDRTRAFFHVAGLAVYEGEAYEDFLASLDDLTTILERAARADGATPARARREAILAIACIRGLLLQRLLSPTADVDAAARAFLAGLPRSFGGARLAAPAASTSARAG